MASIDSSDDATPPVPTENIVVAEEATETKAASETEETHQSHASVSAPDASNQSGDTGDVSSIVDPQEQSQQKAEGAADKADINIANSKGAKILMNRFSTWKETTKQKGQEFLKEQGPTIQQK